MASIRRRVRKDGSTAHQVRWLEGGARDGDPQSEVFDSEPEAIQFKALVDAHGQHWPPGWVKGEGFVQPKTAEEDKAAVTFDVWAERFVDTLTGVEVRTRHDYRRDIRKHFVPTFGSKDICDAEAITPTDVRRWVNALEAGERDKKDKEAWARKPVSPKTLANLHGLLYAVFQAAVEAQPPLRASNPCARTRLPRTDAGIEDEMVFLEREEFALVRAAMADISPGVLNQNAAKPLTTMWSGASSLAQPVFRRRARDGTRPGSGTTGGDALELVALRQVRSGPGRS